MPEIMCRIKNGKRIFTTTYTIFLGTILDPRVVESESTETLASEILWLGNEYGGEPWHHVVHFPSPPPSSPEVSIRKKFLDWMRIDRASPAVDGYVPLTASEKVSFMEAWERIIAIHKLRG